PRPAGIRRHGTAALRDEPRGAPARRPVRHRLRSAAQRVRARRALSVRALGPRLDRRCRGAREDPADRSLAGVSRAGQGRQRAGLSGRCPLDARWAPAGSRQLVGIAGISVGDAPVALATPCVLDVGSPRPPTAFPRAACRGIARTVYRRTSLPSALRYSVDPRRAVIDDDHSASRLLLTPPVDLGRPIRAGVINNPLSFRNRRPRTLAAVRDALLAHPQIPHHDVNRPQDIGAATRELLAAGSELIVVNGGDGTVQAVLTALFSAPGL